MEDSSVSGRYHG